MNLVSCAYALFINRIYVHDGISDTILLSFVGPGPRLAGVAFDGINLISIDPQNDRIYVHRGITDAIIESFATPYNFGVFRGLDYDGTNLLSSYGESTKICVHDRVSSTITREFTTPSTKCRGIGLDGANLISSDNFFDLIYIHDGISNTISSSFATPSNSPGAIVIIDGNLISYDSVTDLIYVHDGISTTIDRTFTALNRTGLTYGERMPPEKPTGLLTQDEMNPTDLTTMTPYFSAIYNDFYGSGIAIHYRIQVNSENDFSGTVLWDSGSIEMEHISSGSRCGNILYDGPNLERDRAYFWRIRFLYRFGGITGWTPWSDELAYFIIPGAFIPGPPKYKLVIGDNILQCEADKQDVFEMHFTLRQNGGCCEFNLSLRAPEFTVNLGDQVSIYLFGDANPWYVGRVLERDRPGSSSRVRKYAGYGHFEQLNGGDLVDKDYGTDSGNPALDTIREIVIDILDVYVRPYTSLITDDNTYIQDVPGYTVTELIFDKVKPMEALTELCELATNYEFGVDENGDFYFRSISTNITERKWVGKHIASYSPKENMRNLINYWYLEGGLLVAGSNYDSFVQDAASIAQWGVRAGKATVPSGFNTAEIAQWGADLLEKTKDPIIKAAISGINIEETETRIWPRGEMRLTSEDGRQTLDFPIRVTTYHITPSGLTADIELGPKATDIRDYFADVLKQIRKEREQLAHDVRQLADGSGLMPDSVNDTHIDWGVGVNQVSAVDVPIADGGGFFVGTEVEAALQEVAAAVDPTIKVLIYLGF